MQLDYILICKKNNNNNNNQTLHQSITIPTIRLHQLRFLFQKLFASSVLHIITQNHQHQIKKKVKSKKKKN